MWVLILLPLVIFLPYLGCYLLSPGSPYNDLLISHLPNTIYLRQAISQYHQIPLWSPTILSGYPFAADPLSGLWYPPGWLAVALPDPWGFNLTLLLHLFWGGLGMYFFLRKTNLSPLGAAFGGMIFAGLPKTIAHLGAGHITLVYAVSWTPWLLLAEVTAAQSPRKRGWQFLPGLVLGMLVLADVRWAIPAGLLWVAYSLSSRWNAEPGKILQLRTLVTWLLGKAGYYLGQGILATLIAAPLLFPLIQYTGLSTRSAMGVDDATVLSLPPARLAGLIFPFLGQNAEWTLYLGGVGLVLLLVAFADRSERRRQVFWWVVLAASLVLSMGDQLPLVRELFRLPGLNLLRVPPRLLFVTGFAVAVIAATALDRFREERGKLPALQKPAVALGLVAVGFFVLIFSAGVVAIAPGKGWAAILCGAAALVAAVVLILSARGRLAASAACVVLVLMLVLDLSAANLQAFDPQPELPANAAVDEVLAKLKDEPGVYRVYSPSYSLPQEAAAADGVDLADGIDPLQLRSYQAFFSRASGIPAGRYSVTLPPFDSGDPEVDNQGYTPDAQLLGLLNVRFVVAQYDLKADGLEEIGRYGEIRLYQNELARERAWIQVGEQPDRAADRPVESLSWTPNAIDVRASGPGKLVLSEVAYPGWKVTVDGVPSQVETVDGLLRAVELDAGEHTVRFDFEPLPVYLGLGAAVLGWGWVIGAWLISRRRGRG